MNTKYLNIQLFVLKYQKYNFLFNTCIFYVEFLIIFSKPRINVTSEMKRYFFLYEIPERKHIIHINIDIKYIWNVAHLKKIKDDFSMNNYNPFMKLKGSFFPVIKKSELSVW